LHSIVCGVLPLFNVKMYKLMFDLVTLLDYRKNDFRVL